ncbi:uncharacterized protein LOC107747078 [Sinocyclocheilus rhinocerous]|uniref:uncharacterized protein LOC107747078 n=1 Tax=Sinocyclocheilus rhinocerous TaxID=307959 RepID=UPI0007BA0208|nr:PREDICTED: uncharacterized protein LOC107747078 [Sinocyclocheilus rhinocerous]
MENAANFSPRKNARKAKELVFERKFIAIKDLKMKNDITGETMFRYLSKDIHEYPSPVEFHITEVAHVTNKTRRPLIWKSGGFKGFKGFGKDSLSWWSLKINEADISAAEERYLEKLFPDITKEEKTAHPPFLSDFTTSPLFLNEFSRYGNFRFTFPLTELMEVYKKQTCEGQEPVLRIYETKLFKQEIEYVVLVHSPEFNEKFRDFPLLTSSPLVAYDGHQIIWTAQAICETHKCKLVKMENGVLTETLEKKYQEFYVWDHVSLVFHITKVLTFPKRKLKANLSCCKLDPKVNLANGENCSSLDEAEKIIESLLVDESEKEDEE